MLASHHPQALAPAPRAARSEAARVHGLTPPELALTLHAAMQAQADSHGAAQELALALARQLRFSRVSLAWAQGLRLKLLARSDGAFVDAQATNATAGSTPSGAGLLDAAAEAFDQSASVAWPAAHGASPAQPTMPWRVTRAHAALVGHQGSAATVLLVVRGQRVGTLTVQRSASATISAEELQQLEHLASLVAPTLQLLKLNERKLAQRLRDGLSARWSAAPHSRRQALQTATACSAALLLLTLLLPWPAHVGGRARLEGAVQRVLAAPADGFVQQVHARAGDHVQAGQLLLELADQDLQLERQRWESQLVQHLDALATAQARQDRTQLVLHQSRADEAQAQLALVDEKLQRSRLVAPFDGIVVQGDWSRQLGTPVKEGAELLTLAPTDRYRVVVDIDERDVALLQSAQPPLSQQGTLTLSALPWDTLPLRVTRVSPVAKAVEGRNVFEAEAELLLPPGSMPLGLRPGLQGTAHIESPDTSPLLHLLRRSLGSLRVAWWEWWG